MLLAVLFVHFLRAESCLSARIAQVQILSKESFAVESQLPADFRALKSVSIFHFHKLYRDPRLLELVGEFLGLRDGNLGVERAMKNEKSCVIFRDMKYRLSLAPDFRMLSKGSAQEAGKKSVAVGVVVGREIGGSADIDHRLHAARIPGQKRIGIVASRLHSQ